MTISHLPGRLQSHVAGSFGNPNARRRYAPRQSHNAVLLSAARFHGLRVVPCKLN